MATDGYISWLDRIAALNVQEDGTDVASARSLNFQTGFNVAFDAGNSRLDVSLDSSALSGSVGSVSKLCNQLNAFPGTTDKQVLVTTGYAAANDGGGGVFVWDAASTTTVNSGTVFGGVSAGRWKRVYSGAIDARWFGAKGDGTTNNTVPLQNAVNATQRVTGTMFLASGVYPITGTITISSDIRIIGDGTRSTTITDAAGYSGSLNLMKIDSTAAAITFDIGGFAFLYGGTQLKITGANGYNRASVLHDIEFLTFTNKGLYVDSEIIGVSWRNVNFQGPGFPGSIGMHTYGPYITHYATFYSFRATTCGTAGAGIYIQDTSPGGGTGNYGTAFHQLTLEGNSGTGLKLYQDDVILYNPYFEGNCIQGGADIELDTGFSGGATVPCRATMYNPTFDFGVGAAQLTGSSNRSIHIKNHFCTVNIYDAVEHRTHHMDQGVYYTTKSSLHNTAMKVSASFGATSARADTLGYLSPGAMAFAGSSVGQATGINVNADFYGATALFMVSTVDAGTHTTSSLYMFNYAYGSSTGWSTTLIAGPNNAMFDVTSSMLYVKAIPNVNNLSLSVLSSRGLVSP